MINLHPLPYSKYDCPYCNVQMTVKGWHIPGMRNLALLNCCQCNRDFFADLPVGHGLFYPMILECSNGFVHDRYGVPWFARWLRDSYATRINKEIRFQEENIHTIKNPIILNCMDTIYGHSLEKLLNAQYYIKNHPELDIILIIQPFLRWMVPDNVASIWTVELPLREGIVWNEWLASEIKHRIESFKKCLISIAFPEPNLEDIKIDKFTKIAPFQIEEWSERLQEPTITFIWREDRLILETVRRKKYSSLFKRINNKLGLFPQPIDKQKQWVIHLSQAIRRIYPNLNFAVVGIGRSVRFPSWIKDLRTLKINEKIERAWCYRYSQSHIVLGVHGSNMLLPSAHAGSVIEFIPNNRWGNLTQDIITGVKGARESIYRYRFLPVNTSVRTIVEVIDALLKYLPTALLHIKNPWCDHTFISKDPSLLHYMYSDIKKRINGLM